MIYILMPVYNRKAITLQMVACLKAQTYTQWKLVLIDDGSTDGTSEAVKGEISDAVVLRGNGSLWWAGALQAGINWLYDQRVGPESLVLFLNDDQKIEPDFLERAVKLLEDRTKTLLLPYGYDVETKEVIPGERGIHIDWDKLGFIDTEDPEKIDCFSTRALFLRLKDIRDIGGFRPHLLPHYHSDFEFTHRAKNHGYSLLATPQLKVFIHQELTGPRSLKQTAGKINKLSLLFSERYPGNPIRYSVFAALISPKTQVLRNVVKPWLGLASGAIKKIAGAPRQ